MMSRKATFIPPPRALPVQILYGVVVFLMLLGQWRPLLLVDVSPEPWILVLSEAASGRYRFGTDIVFTGGPLSDIYTRLFNPATYAAVLLVVYGLVTLQALALTTLAARSGSLFFHLLLLPALFFIVARDVQVMLTPFLVALVVLGRPTGPGAVIMTIAGAVASALSTLIKFSLFPLSVALFLLVDLNRLRLRAFPVATIAYAATYYLSFVLVAPAGSNFLAYFKGSLETSSGYSAAMAIAGPLADAAIYAALAAAAFMALAASERRRVSDGGEFGWNSAAQTLATLLFVWITLKIGFVRHDLHVLTALSGLALAVCAFGLSRLPPQRIGRIAAATLAAVVVGAGLFSHAKLATDPGMRFPLAKTLTDHLVAVPEELARTADALRDPGAWLETRLSRREEALTELARESPIEEIEGTIDSIASIQASLIANGLAYQPRPTIQEYTTYTRALIHRNRAFFAGANGPRYVLFEASAIDERFPGLAEGASWPVFLAAYAPERMGNNDVLLRRRAAPLGDLLGSPVGGDGELGAPLPIEFGPDPVFLSLDVKPTLLGRIADLLLKPSFLYLGVTTTQGTEQIFRLIPAIAREGFIVSPVVRTNRDFVRLAEGTSAENMQRVKSLRVFAGFGGKFTYEPTISYTVQRIDRTRLVAGRNWALTAEQAISFDRQRTFEAIIATSGAPGPGLMIIDEGLFVHAPRRLPLDVAVAGALEVGFGLMPGSWSGGNTTNGVCFRILDAEGKTALWERCLDPLKVEADRVGQKASVPLPAGTERIVLETDCRGDCGWDWSYWSEITPIRR